MCYDGFEDMFHDRIILCHIVQGEYMIATPDFDIYPEAYSGGNPDIVAIRVQSRLPMISFSPGSASAAPMLSQICRAPR